MTGAPSRRPAEKSDGCCRLQTGWRDNVPLIYYASTITGRAGAPRAAAATPKETPMVATSRELPSSPMTERQRAYRATYRERVAGWYDGWLHVFIIYVTGALAMYVYIANLSAVRAWALLIVPVVLLGCN